MKIVDKKHFYSLPERTLFSFYKPATFNGLCIKGPTMWYDNKPCDFTYRSLIGNVECNDSGDFIDILEQSVINKTSFKLDFECSERDGLFDEKALYAIYEKEDVKLLIKTLSECV